MLIFQDLSGTFNIVNDIGEGDVLILARELNGNWTMIFGDGFRTIAVNPDHVTVTEEPQIRVDFFTHMFGDS